METRNYEQFKMLEGNRKSLSRNQIEKIKKSISEYGYLTEFPIIVDSGFYILDGQHRFIACKELGIPIVYGITEYSKGLIPALNVSQKSWGLADFCHYYAVRGNEALKKVTDLAKDTGLSENMVLHIIGDTKGVKDGSYSNDIRKEEAETLIHQIKELSSLITGRTISRKLIRAVRFLKDNGVNLDSLIKQVKRYRDLVYLCATMEGYIKMLYSVYNYRNKNKLKLAIY